MISRIIGALIIVAVIAAAVMLMNRRETESTSSVTSENRVQEPGYSARNAEVIETGPDGRPMYTLRADIIRQLPDSKTVTLEVVNMELRDEDGSHWTARADYGEIMEDAINVNLVGAVKVTGVLPGSYQPAEIHTERLAFNTETEIVKTRSPVMLNWGGRRINAQGMEASLKEQSLRLESRVHGIFSN